VAVVTAGSGFTGGGAVVTADSTGAWDIGDSGPGGLVRHVEIRSTAPKPTTTAAAMPIGISVADPSLP
jgi:hypothetical protein